MKYAYLYSTLCLIVMSCGAGCANVLHDTPAKTELEVAQCYHDAERTYILSHDEYCGAEVSPADCPFTETLRTHRRTSQDACESSR